MIKYYFSLLIFLLAVNVVCAQNNQLTGIVIDEDEHQALVAAAIKVGNSTVYSDITGRFVLQNLAPGLYTLEVKSLGFERVVIDSVLVPTKFPVVVFLRQLDVCGQVEEEARRDLSIGKVYLRASGFEVAFSVEIEQKIKQLEMKYGYETVQMGCTYTCAERYNAVVGIYLDLRNGKGWQQRFSEEFKKIFH